MGALQIPLHLLHRVDDEQPPVFVRELVLVPRGQAGPFQHFCVQNDCPEVQAGKCQVLNQLLGDCQIPVASGALGVHIGKVQFVHTHNSMVSYLRVFVLSKWMDLPKWMDHATSSSSAMRSRRNGRSSDTARLSIDSGSIRTWLQWSMVPCSAADTFTSVLGWPMSFSMQPAGRKGIQLINSDVLVHAASISLCRIAVLPNLAILWSTYSSGSSRSSRARRTLSVP